MKKLAIAGLLLALTLSPLYAQESGNVDEAPMGGQEATMPVSSDGNVSLDFRDADIQNVLRILSYKSGVNIVAGPEVTGLVTIKLKEVPWKKALEVILQTYGYAYEEAGNIITVTTIENMKKRREDQMVLAEQEPLKTKTFILNYAKAGTIIESISKMKTERGSINYDERTNSLIITDVANNLELIGGVIETLDRPTPQVLIESKIVETNLSDTDKLGIEWTAMATVSGSTRPHVWPFTTSSSNKYLPDDIPSTEDGFSYGTLNFHQTSAVLEALKTRTDTNILSNPRIVTLNNQKATIDVGIEYPFPKKFFNEETGSWQLSDWEYKKIGIILDVTPSVNNSGIVTLELNPKVTEILELVQDAESGSEAPKLSNEEAKTRVMIKDGDTLVIAGLIKDKIIDTKRKLPFLGDIPILGYLFRKNEKTVTKTDLLIFVTPHIVTPEVSQE